MFYYVLKWSIRLLFIFIYSLVCTVNFGQSTYSYDEDAGPAQPVLVLSNPSSTDITVQVLSTDGTATGEFVKHSTHKICAWCLDKPLLLAFIMLLIIVG